VHVVWSSIVAHYIDHYWIANQVALGDTPYYVAIGPHSQKKVDVSGLEELKAEARGLQTKFPGLKIVIVHEVKQFKSKPSKVDSKTSVPIV
jgi:hypothetical protein